MEKIKNLSTVQALIGSAVLAVILLVITGMALSGQQETQEDDMVIDLGYGVAISSFRLEITKEALDGSGNITEQMCEDIKSAVRDFDSTANWFSGCTGVFQVDTKDSDLVEVMTISDTDYCATISTRNSEVVGYDFENTHCRGYRTFIE